MVDAAVDPVGISGYGLAVTSIKICQWMWILRNKYKPVFCRGKVKNEK